MLAQDFQGDRQPLNKYELLRVAFVAGVAGDDDQHVEPTKSWATALDSHD